MTLGAIGLPISLAVLFVPFSPLSGVEPERLPIVLALWLLSGPPWMLPLAILARWWPRTSGRLLLGGAVSAIVITAHPWGLEYASSSLYVDIWFVVPFISFVTAAIGIGLIVAARPGRRWLDVTVTAFVAYAMTHTTLFVIGFVDARTPWRTEHPVTFLAFAPDGRSLIAGSQETSYSGTSVVDVSTGAVTALAPGSFYQSIGPDGTTLATVDGDTTRLWDTRTFQELRSLPKPYFSRSIAVSRDVVAQVQRDGVLIVDAKGGARRASLDNDSTNNNILAVSADGLWLAAGGQRGTSLWDLRATSVRVLPGRTGETVISAQFSPDGSMLALLTGSSLDTGTGRQHRNFLRVHRTTDGRELKTFEDSRAIYPWDSPWFSPDGKSLVTVREEARTDSSRPTTNLLSFWDTSTWRQHAMVTSDFGAMAWSPDNLTVAVVVHVLGSGYTAVLRNVRDGSPAGDLGLVDFYPAQALAFSPDGSRLAVGGIGDTARRTMRGRVRVFQVR